MANAFHKRETESGLWEIYDIDDEEVIVVDGLPLSGLGAGEADEALLRLQAGDIVPDNPETPIAGRVSSDRLE